MNQTESKNQRGGRRKGAGRKPSTLRGIVKKLPCLSAELILHEIQAQSKLIELAKCKDPSIRLQTIKFLWEQAYGKAKQPVEQSGKLTHEHYNVTGLSDEQLAQVRELVDSAKPSGSDLG